MHRARDDAQVKGTQGSQALTGLTGSQRAVKEECLFMRAPTFHLRSLRERFAAVALGALGCTSPRTEIVARVSTDLSTGPGAALQSLTIEVRRGGPAGELRLQHRAVLGAGTGEWTLPSTIGLLPKDGDTGATVWIAVSGCESRASCEASTAVVTQRAVVSYVRDETLLLDLVLASRCAGVRCVDTETCSPLTGLCVSAARQSELRVWNSAPSAAPDASMVDGGAVDGAAVDVASRVDASSAPMPTSCTASTVPGCGTVAMEGGSFSMGTTLACSSELSVGERCALRASPPTATVRVDPFVLDAYEVTVARFRRFWTARAADRGASIRARPVVYPGGRSITFPTTASSAPSTSAGCAWTASEGANESLPIDCLSYWLAMEFCVWDGGRLPTEAEWEYAARWRAVPSEGLAPGRWYPWGDDVTTAYCDRARWNAGNTAGCTRWGAAAAPVGSFAPTGGVYDLAGNAWELTADRYTTFGEGCWAAGGDNPLCTTTGGATTAADERIVTRGGGWNSVSTAWLRTPSRRQAPPDSPGLGIGFRCARSP